jgi:4-amino-4-deoxy-L-arabinose transferase-like glycosyltransferase
MHGWLGLAGDSEVALRLPSVLAGLALVLIGWRWAHEALGRWPGLVALAVLALSPLAIANARDARMYALESAFAVSGWWLTWRLLSGRTIDRAGRFREAALLGLAVAGVMWTLALGVVVAGLQGLVVVAAVVVERRGIDGRRAADGAALALAGLVAGGLSFLPWLPSMLGLAAGGEPFWTPTPGTFDWAVSLGSMILGPREDLFGFVIIRAALLVLMAIGVAWLVLSGERARSRLGWCLLAGLAFPFLVWTVSQARSIYDTRYLGAALGPLSLGLAAGGVAGWRTAQRFVGRVRLRTRGAAAGTEAPAALVLVVLLVWLMAGPVRAWLDDWRLERGLAPTRELVAALQPQLRDGDALLALDARSYFPLAYYAAQSARQGRPLPALRDWDSGAEPFYRGQSLLPPGSIIDEATVRSLGWHGALPGLADDGHVWLVALANGRSKDLGFAPLDRGELVEVERLIVEHEGNPGQARELEVVEEGP